MRGWRCAAAAIPLVFAVVDGAQVERVLEGAPAALDVPQYIPDPPYPHIFGTTWRSAASTSSASGSGGAAPCSYSACLLGRQQTSSG
jgi:hypothetical protein